MYISTLKNFGSMHTKGKGEGKHRCEPIGLVDPY